MNVKRGVYFLANNKVYDLAIAFLNSFRKHNNEIALCLIPYNEDSQMIFDLKEEYNFTIFNKKEVLDFCDDVSVHFHPKKLGAYRKLAAWQGDFDEFVYIDLDTVVLDNIDFAFQFLSVYPVFTSLSNEPGLVKSVWKNSIYEKNTLTLKQIEYSANTGFLVSRKNLFSMDFIKSKIDAALELKDDMVLFCMEQPFLNYLIVTSHHKYSSLLQMSARNLNLQIKQECWAGDHRGIVKNGKFRIPNGPKYFLVHWAGLWQESGDGLRSLPYRDLWIHYRNLNPKYLLPCDVSNADVTFLTSVSRRLKHFLGIKIT